MAATLCRCIFPSPHSMSTEQLGKRAPDDPGQCRPVLVPDTPGSDSATRLQRERQKKDQILEIQEQLLAKMRLLDRHVNGDREFPNHAVTFQFVKDGGQRIAAKDQRWSAGEAGTAIQFSIRAGIISDADITLSYTQLVQLAEENTAASTILREFQQALHWSREIMYPEHVNGQALRLLQTMKK